MIPAARLELLRRFCAGEIDSDQYRAGVARLVDEELDREAYEAELWTEAGDAAD